MSEFSEIAAACMRRRRVSWRRYGPNGEKRRPIIHRFDIKGGDRIIDILVADITRTCALLDRLKK